MEIQTTRFGTIDIQKDQIISIPSGIIGFPGDQHYVLLEHERESPFFWFQSVDNGSLAFVLVDPFLFKPDYEFQISPEDMAALELENGGEGIQGLQPLVIVNISKGVIREITANLLGPVLFNLQKKLAKQIILYHQPYSHRFPILLTQNEKAP